MKNLYCLILILSGLLIPLQPSWGQGLTTSSMAGTITDDTGAGLPGATVVATHGPTGTRYGTTSLVDGRFAIPNMRVGGPYTVETSFIGFQTQRFENITLRLGEPHILNIRLGQAGTQLQEVTVSATRSTVLNAERTGASTNIDRQQIENLPTLSRSLQDFTRLTPQANGNSFGGASNRFNNITIDGAVNNDVFGLSGTGTPGGQAGTQPISLDAIQEIQVVLAPYDITYGNFTGGGVNAVTRSGTNDFQGSVYTFLKNEDLVGKSPLTDTRFARFTDSQYGFRLGGPILKNKLFFFVNGEIGQREAPLSNNAGEPGAAISLATAQLIRDTTLARYGYDVGAFGPTELKRNNDKLFGRLDWNINDQHQLTLRYNLIDAFDDNLSRSGSSFSFANNAYTFNNNQKISVMELRSNFTPSISNNLILGYSRIRDNRQTAGTPFPQIQILNLEGIPANSAFFGTERSSFANELDQDIFEITDNFRYTLGKHTFTVGTHNEFFKFRNLFINNLTGRWDFNSLADYLANRPARARVGYSLIPGEDRPASEFKAMQLGFYAQDEFEALTGLRLTVGLRADIPILPDEPLFNPGVTATFPGVRTDQTPSGQVLWAPRVGFNYDVTGDRSLQLRGGAGIFTGRVPFVWLSNQFVNSGLVLGTIDVSGVDINNGNGFQPDVSQQRTVGGAVATTEINAVDRDFRIPQIASPRSPALTWPPTYSCLTGWWAPWKVFTPKRSTTSFTATSTCGRPRPPSTPFIREGPTCGPCTAPAQPARSILPTPMSSSWTTPTKATAIM
jgi:outer membrane receptor protein involved in Fe transport